MSPSPQRERINSAGASYDGQERSPMRNAEARVTLGVIAARNGDLERAVDLGEQALDGERKSLPSLLMCSRELGNALRQADEKHPAVASYLEHLRVLAHAG
jgi:hypothetical protein